MPDNAHRFFRLSVSTVRAKPFENHDRIVVGE
jgi:hypothetical protein